MVNCVSHSRNASDETILHSLDQHLQSLTLEQKAALAIAALYTATKPKDTSVSLNPHGGKFINAIELLLQLSLQGKKRSCESDHRRISGFRTSIGDKKMKRQAIDVTDVLTLVAVWELQEGYWELLTIVRLRYAIALARESFTTRLVFPTGVLPNGVWGGEIYKNGVAKTNPKKGDVLQKRQEMVLQLLENSPGQTRDSLASHLDLSVATVRQLLNLLEKQGKIHHRPHPMQNKTKLYYVGAAPTDTGKTDNQSSSVRSTRSAPPLKVYFVDPRTLQSLNR